MVVIKGRTTTLSVGFTGTRAGMSNAQMAAVARLLAAAGKFTAHHGDCVGADHDFHKLARDAKADCLIVHPPLDSSKRAYCHGEITHPPKPYMVRNRDIVDAADVMIATPREVREQARGGTWRTVWMTRNAGKPLFLVWPDGSVDKERMP